MVPEGDAICQGAIKFLKKLFRVYFEDGNIEKLENMLHEDVSLIGTRGKEICRGCKDTAGLFEAERNIRQIDFKILDEQYRIAATSEQFCIVYGTATLMEDGMRTMLFDMQFRFSAVCSFENGEYKLYHGHFSVADQPKMEDDLVSMVAMQDHNVLLEQKLVERTRMLRDKTRELENLANNIAGGVQVCIFDDDYTMLYVSDGFLRMTGYSRKEIEQKFKNKYANMFSKEEAERIRNELNSQIEQNHNFTVEYKLKKKDGTTIWILDKGNLITVPGQVTRVQCIMTDITIQKEQEEELMISHRRYEIAMKLTDVQTFEYNIQTKELIFYHDMSEMYDLPRIIPDGVETLISRGIIEPGSVESFRQMYRRIHEGSSSAGCYVNVRDKYGNLYDFQLLLTTVFNDQHQPIRAVGVRDNVSQMRQLQKEEEFGKTLVFGKKFIFEADITKDLIVDANPKWENSMGDIDSQKFSVKIKSMIEEFVVPEHRKMMLDKLSREAIIGEFENGEQLIRFEYKQITRSGEYKWQEATVNIIKDQLKGNISIRAYIMNINDRKVKEQKAAEEKCLYETMVNKAMLAYEVNFTQNIFVLGIDDWNSLYGINLPMDYDTAIWQLHEKAIYEAERDEFWDKFSRARVEEQFKNGRRMIECQYRRLSKGGNWQWVRCTLHLFEDPDTEDIRGYFYVEDIDKQKREEITLKYNAEHDSLTGIYNRATTERMISEFLILSEAKEKEHAFIMVDIDYFKAINDNLGHAFGDEVLREIANKVKGLFREEDIVGRLGGDEFCIFMKDVPKIQFVEAKAKEICDALIKNYCYGQINITVSASVGVAMSSRYGKNYEELYKNADWALYTAKRNGRNRFCVR